jgi:hypothetical protein
MQSLDCLGHLRVNFAQMAGFSRIDSNVLRIANHFDRTDPK